MFLDNVGVEWSQNSDISDLIQLKVEKGGNIKTHPAIIALYIVYTDSDKF